MSADKLLLQSKLLRTLMDHCLSAADIGDDHIGVDKRRKLFEVAGVLLNRCTEKNDITGRKSGINVIPDVIENAILQCRLDAAASVIVRINDMLGERLADTLCEGAADETKPQKTNRQMFHNGFLLIFY